MKICLLTCHKTILGTTHAAGCPVFAAMKIRTTSVVAVDRDELDPCQAGTVGCSVDHLAGTDFDCETW